MSALSEQNLVCKDCETTFLFTAAEAKEFTEKGYENLPLRCAECREKRRGEYGRRRRAPAGARRAPAGEKPPAIPPSASVVFDGKTVMTNGKIALIRRGFGFIEYDSGRVYFPIDSFGADKATMRVGMHVDFVCEKDETDRIFAKSVNAAANPPAQTAEEAAAAAAAPADGSRRRAPRARAPRAPREAAAAAADAAPRPPREMIDITVQCAGKASKTIQKPKERATFSVFRKLISREYKGELASNFQLYNGDDLLTYDAFNALSAGAVVTLKEIERKEETAAKA